MRLFRFLGLALLLACAPFGLAAGGKEKGPNADRLIKDKIAILVQMAEVAEKKDGAKAKELKERLDRIDKALDEETYGDVRKALAANAKALKTAEDRLQWAGNDPDGLMREMIAVVEKMAASLEKKAPEAELRKLGDRLKELEARSRALKLSAEDKKILGEKHAPALIGATRKLMEAAQKNPQGAKFLESLQPSRPQPVPPPGLDDPALPPIPPRETPPKKD